MGEPGFRFIRKKSLRIGRPVPRLYKKACPQIMGLSQGRSNMTALDQKMEESRNTGRLIELIKRMSDEEQRDLVRQLEERLFDGKREYDRKHYFSVVDYNTQEAGHTGFIENISASGVFIGTSKSFSVGEEISMAFPLPISQEHVRIQGEVVRVSSEGIGVRFKAVGDEQEEMIKQLVGMM